MSRICLPIICIGLVLAACEKPVDKLVLKEEPANCAEQRDELKRWLELLWDEGDNISSTVLTGVEPVELSASRETVQLAPTIEVGRQSITFGGEHMTEVAAITRQASPGAESVVLPELKSRLEAELRAFCTHYDQIPKDMVPDVHTLRIALDKTTPWQVVRAVVDTVYAAGYDRAIFIFRTATRVPPPGPVPELQARIKAIEAKLEANRKAGRVVPVGDPVMDDGKPHPNEMAFGECKPAQELLGGTGKNVPESRKEAILRIPDALVECDCATSPDEVRTILWWWSGRYNSNYVATAATVNLAAAKGGRRGVAAADSTAWSDAHKQLLAALDKHDGALFLTSSADADQAKAERPSRVPTLCSQ